MQNIFKSILLTLSAFLILGCGGASPKPSASTMPNWYLNQPLSDANNYYGVGSGSSKEAAYSNALAQVGGEISTKISSSTDMTDIDSNDKFTSDTTIKTKTSIETMKFTGVTVVQNAYVDGKFYTYLEVNRNVLYKAQKRAFDENYNKLTSFYASAKNKNVFSLIKNKSKIESSVVESSSKLPILKTINAKFDQDKYAKVLSNISNDARDAASNAMVYVTNKNAKEYQEILKQYITGFGMTVVRSPKSVKNKKNLLKVHVTKRANPKTVKSSDPRLKGAFFADVIVNLSTKDYSNKEIASNRIAVINISKQSYKAAVVKTKKFEREIKRKGIVNILLKKSSK